MSEIRLRATIRIGELSRELEKALPNKGHGAGLPSDGKTKEEQLAEAGLSTTTAGRYEQLSAYNEETKQSARLSESVSYRANWRKPNLNPGRAPVFPPTGRQRSSNSPKLDSLPARDT